MSGVQRKSLVVVLASLCVIFTNQYTYNYVRLFVSIVLVSCSIFNLIRLVIPRLNKKKLVASMDKLSAHVLQYNMLVTDFFDHFDSALNIYNNQVCKPVEGIRDILLGLYPDGSLYSMGTYYVLSNNSDSYLYRMRFYKTFRLDAMVIKFEQKGSTLIVKTEPHISLSEILICNCDAYSELSEFIKSLRQSKTYSLDCGQSNGGFINVQETL